MQLRFISAVAGATGWSWNPVVQHITRLVPHRFIKSLIIQRCYKIKGLVQQNGDLNPGETGPIEDSSKSVDNFGSSVVKPLYQRHLMMNRAYDDTTKPF